MKLACIRHLPKNKNSIIDQSQRALYDTYFLNSNIGMRNVATLGKSVEKYEPDCLVVYSFSNIFYSYASYCTLNLNFEKKQSLSSMNYLRSNANMVYKFTKQNNNLLLDVKMKISVFTPL